MATLQFILTFFLLGMLSAWTWNEYKRIGSPAFFPVIAAALSLCLLFVATQSTRSEPMCTDLSLVVLADISPSMDTRERKLQRDGYEAAFRSKDVWDVINHPSSPCGAIRVTYVEYAYLAKVGVEWHTIDTREAAFEFADRIALYAENPHSLGKMTSHGNAVMLAKQLLEGEDSIKKKIDLSSDGLNNEGATMEKALAALNPEGTYELDRIVINTLPMTFNISPLPPKLLLDEMRKWKGEDGFMEIINTHEDIAPTIIRKLVREIG